MEIQMDISILGRHWALLNWMYVIYIFFFSMNIMLNHVFFQAKIPISTAAVFVVCSQQLPNLHSTLQGCAPGLGGKGRGYMSLLKMLPDCFLGIIWNRIGTKHYHIYLYIYIYTQFFVPFHLFQICPEMLFSLFVLSGDSQEAIIRIELRQQKAKGLIPW